MALDPTPSFTRTPLMMTSSDSSLPSTLQTYSSASTHVTYEPIPQISSSIRTTHPFHHTRDFFPQATAPLFVPNETDVPESWRPRFDKAEKSASIRAILLMMGFFALAVLWPALTGLVSSCWNAECFKPEDQERVRKKRRDREEIEAQERRMEEKEDKRSCRWFT